MQISVTIMADYGGAYLWVRALSDAMDKVSAGYDAGIQEQISEALHVELSAWQRVFEYAPSNNSIRISLLNWQQFNQDGMVLAQKVKRQLGPDVRVYYEKPYEDPNTQHMARVELFSESMEVCPSPPRWLHSGRIVPIWLPLWIVGDTERGVSRAALDWAICEAIPHCGFTNHVDSIGERWIGKKYLLDLLPASTQRQALGCNVEQADAILVLLGSEDHEIHFSCDDCLVTKPVLRVVIEHEHIEQQRDCVRQWLLKHMPPKLLITGPSDSIWSESYNQTEEFLHLLIPAPEDSFF